MVIFFNLKNNQRCGHCKSLAPEYAKLAKGFDGIVNIGAVDMDATPVIILIFKIHFFKKDVGSPYGIKGFPTLKFFGDNKNSPIDYNGERNFAAMQDFIFD
jgi:protein disulfide-isomerase A6